MPDWTSVSQSMAMGNRAPGHARYSQIMESAQEREQVNVQSLTTRSQSYQYDCARRISAGLHDVALTEANKTEEKGICGICFDKVADCVFVPCGHLGFCMACSEQQALCPICRNQIQIKQKVYYV